MLEMSAIDDGWSFHTDGAATAKLRGPYVLLFVRKRLDHHGQLISTLSTAIHILTRYDDAIWCRHI